MENNYLIRKVKASDLDGLVKLFNDVWPDVVYNKKAKAEFVVLHSNSINYCAVKDEEIVGSRLSFYMNFYYANKALRCIQVCDTCTREDCRGQGILSRMNALLIDDFFNKQKGDLIWNVSANASKKVNEKLGWYYIQSFVGLIRVVRPFRLMLKIGLNVKRLLGNVDWNLEEFPVDIDPILLNKREELLRRLELLHMCYDEPTLKWRTGTKSGMRAFFVPKLGCIVYKIGEMRGLKYVLIGEVFLYDYNRMNFRKLLKSFDTYVCPDVIKAAVSLGHPLYHCYRSNGFIRNPKSRFYNHGVRIPSNKHDINAMVFQPYKWAVSMLDVDTF